METRNKDTANNTEVFRIWDIKENQKICAFDLDDTLAKSIECWINYVNKKLKTHFTDLNEMKNNISYNKYRNLKCEYRNSDEKLSIKAIKNASCVTKLLKTKNYQIIIITARPFNRHKNLFNITTEWLTKNSIQFDGIIWGEDKHIKVMTEVENLNFIVEDHRYIANKCGKFGIKTYLLDNKYNKGDTHNNVIRIYDLMEVLKNEP